MASLCLPKSKAFFFFLFSLHFFVAISTEFDVGGDKGWIIPPAKDDQLYNDWASKNRFKVDDVLRFEYKKDSVMEVTQEEYEKCRSSQPMFFSNNGNTEFKLDRPGLFYFISGVAGHCERGLKMIIKVLEPQSPPQSANETATPSPDHHHHHKKNGGVNNNMMVSPPSLAVPVVFFMLILGPYLVGFMGC